MLDGSGILGLQRAIGNAGVGALLESEPAEEQRSPVHDVVNSGGGSPLAPDVREEMQGRLGHDFSDVRVHTDSAAHDSAKSVNAHAYTVGTNVVFQRDKYDPASAEGKTMLAHELTHVIQQRSGPVEGTDTGGGITFNLYTNPQEDLSIGIRHIPMGVPIMAASGAYMKDLIKYPPQFKIGFMSNNPPIYDIGPEAKMGLKAWLKEHGFGRLTP